MEETYWTKGRINTEEGQLRRKGKAGGMLDISPIPLFLELTHEHTKVLNLWSYNGKQIGETHL